MVMVIGVEGVFTNLGQTADAKRENPLLEMTGDRGPLTGYLSSVSGLSFPVYFLRSQSW